MKLFPVLVSLSVLVGCAPAQAPSLGPGRYVEKVKVNGTERSFVLRVPKSYVQGKKLPLVVVYHGFGGDGRSAEEYTQFGAKSETEGFVAVFPDGTGNQKGWNAGFINLTGSGGADDVKFTETILDDVEKKLTIDEDRVFLAGHSNGAMLAHYLGSKLSGRVAAIGAVAGTIGFHSASSGMKVIPTPDSPVSVMIIHGKADPTVGYDSSAKALLKGYGAEETASWWARVDGCNPEPVVTKSADGNVITESFAGGKGDSETRLVSIVNGEHSWPGGWHYVGGKAARETKTGVNACDLIWEFFKAHPKRK